MEFTNLEQINKKYCLFFSNRDLTSFEKEIINSPKPINIINYNLNNIDILNSLSIYYDIEINKPQSEMKGTYENNIKYFMTINEKLSKLGSSKGFLRIGAYFMGIDDIDKGIEYFIKAIEINDEDSKLAKHNLALCYERLGKFNDALELLFECLDKDNISHIIIIYSDLNNLEETVKWIEYGIYKQSKDCLDLLEELLKDSTMFYWILLSLPFTNDVIENKKRQILPRINNDIISSYRDNNPILLIGGITPYIPGCSKELIEKFN